MRDILDGTNLSADTRILVRSWQAKVASEAALRRLGDTTRGADYIAISDGARALRLAAAAIAEVLPYSGGGLLCLIEPPAPVKAAPKAAAAIAKAQGRSA